jgi:uncharacterized protein YjbI with pentapeptide repeats
MKWHTGIVFTFLFGISLPVIAAIVPADSTHQSAAQNFPLNSAVNIPAEKTYDQVLQTGANQINQAISHARTTFTQPVVFEQKHFNHKVDFTLSRFQEDAKFYNSTFAREADFTWSKFYKAAGFSHVNFNNTALFYGSIFNNEADFYDCKFSKKADFEHVKFDNIANFSSTYFSSNAWFHAASFKQDADFYRATFKNSVNFSDAIFNKAANFSRVYFATQANFEGASFNGEINFNQTVMPEYLNLSYVKIKNGIIDISNTLPPLHSSYSRINLVGTDINKIRMHYKYFKLYFPKNTSLRKINNVYEKLLFVLKQSGYENDYQKLSIEYKKFTYKTKNQYILNFIQKYWWNYGFSKERVYLWIVTILLVLSIVNTFLFPMLIKYGYKMPFLHTNYSESMVKQNILARLTLQFPLAFIYTVTITFNSFIGFRRTVDEIKRGNLFITCYNIFMMILGFILALFILNNIIGKV